MLLVCVVLGTSVMCFPWPAHALWTSVNTLEACLYTSFAGSKLLSWTLKFLMVASSAGGTSWRLRALEVGSVHRESRKCWGHLERKYSEKGKMMVSIDEFSDGVFSLSIGSATD